MSAELDATGEVVAQGLREVTTSIEAVHRQIARRSFGASGRPASPAHVLHDTIAGAVYAGVRGGLSLGALGAGRLAALTSPRWASPERRAAGAAARAALNGAFGDALVRDGNELAIPMAVRVGGADVPPTRGALQDAFPDATPRLAVFLHGLCEADTHWRPGSARGYGARLRADLGYTAVHLRYNTGLRIVDNGERLNHLLGELVAAWPGGARDVVLIGHSMGGLVIRAACHTGAQEGAAWVGLVRNAVYLGAPHGGASLEKGARLLATTLRRVPEVRPLAAAIDRRSAGIHDLGDGLVSETHVPLGAGIRHHAVCATVGGHTVLGHLLGDLLVRRGSATGRGSRSRPDLAFDAADVRHVPNATHFDLLCHPGVYEQLRTWIARDTRDPAPTTVTRRLLPRRTGEGRRRPAR